MRFQRTVDYLKSIRNGRMEMHPVTIEKVCKVKHVKAYTAMTNPPRAKISTSMQWED